MDREERHLLSAAFFCPQSRAPDEEYLAVLHSFLRQNQYGQILLQEVLDLESIWSIFENARDDVRALSQGRVYIDILRGWAANGESYSLSEVRSGIIALPLLIILQIGQYLRYLEFSGLAHQDFLAEIRYGGAQGYCGGLPSAIALACARDETEVVVNAGIAMRISLGIGAYSQAADEGNGTGTTTLALRLKYEGQGDELARLFPGVCTYFQKHIATKRKMILTSSAFLDSCFSYYRPKVCQHGWSGSEARGSVQLCPWEGASGSEDGYHGEGA